MSADGPASGDDFRGIYASGDDLGFWAISGGDSVGARTVRGEARVQEEPASGQRWSHCSGKSQERARQLSLKDATPYTLPWFRGSGAGCTANPNTES